MSAIDIDKICAEWPCDPHSLTIRDLSLVLMAADWAGFGMGALSACLANLGLGTRLEDVNGEDVDVILDWFVALGFRHPAIPLISREQMRCLRDCRQQLGLTSAQAQNVVRQIGGARSMGELDGAGFLAMWRHYRDLGASIPMPIHDFFDRVYPADGKGIHMLHQNAFYAGVSPRSFIALRVLFGGTERTHQINENAYYRLLAKLQQMGAPGRVIPAPRVERTPGMITQAQANLIWSMWLQADRTFGEMLQQELDGAIDEHFGFTGGLASLTQLGAAAVIERMLEPIVARRRDRDTMVAAMAEIKAAFPAIEIG